MTPIKEFWNITEQKAEEVINQLPNGTEFEINGLRYKVNWQGTSFKPLFESKYNAYLLCALTQELNDIKIF